VIRTGRPSDMSAIRDVERSVAAMARGTIMDFPANIAPNHQADLVTAIERGLMWVAQPDAPGLDGAAPDEIRAIGFLFAERFPEGLYLRELAVATTAQRQGHGRALMLASLDHARARGERRAMLTTQRNLPWNAPFYAKLGFRIVENDDIPIEARRRLVRQFTTGFDPATRCAMVMDIQ
jgi:predicted N-acetyltransferase YhbS